MPRIKITGFNIGASGDETVGINPALWQLSGDFYFEDIAELDEFKALLGVAFETIVDPTELGISTFEDDAAQADFLEDLIEESDPNLMRSAADPSQGESAFEKAIRETIEGDSNKPTLEDLQEASKLEKEAAATWFSYSTKDEGAKRIQEYLTAIIQEIDYLVGKIDSVEIEIDQEAKHMVKHYETKIRQLVDDAYSAGVTDTVLEKYKAYVVTSGYVYDPEHNQEVDPVLKFTIPETAEDQGPKLLDTSDPAFEAIRNWLLEDYDDEDVEEALEDAVILEEPFRILQVAYGDGETDLVMVDLENEVYHLRHNNRKV